VTLQRASIDIRSMGDGMLMGVDLDALEVRWELKLDGLKNCGGLEVAPGGTIGAVACTGYIDPDGIAESIDDSGIVVFDLSSEPPSEIQRFPARELAGVSLQSELEFFAERRLLAKTQTALDGTGNNRLLAVELGVEDARDAAEVLLEARPSASGAGQGVVLGGMLCTPGCGGTCLVADADRGVLERFTIDGDTLTPLGGRALTGTVGLPPRELGAL